MGTAVIQNNQVQLLRPISFPGAARPGFGGGFSDAFVETVSTPGLLYHSVRWRWLRRRRFNEPTARRFALAWDRAITSLKGFRNLELRREEHMARELGRLCGRHRKVLAVLELERMEGVLSRLPAGVKEAGRKDTGAKEAGRKESKGTDEGGEEE